MSEFYGPGESKKVVEDRYDANQRGVPLTKMGDGEVKALNAKMEAIKKLLDTKVVAKYKIEVQFGRNRSTWKPFAGALVLHTSGTKLHGGGDEGLYMCPRNGCSGVIRPEHLNDNHGYCMSCGLWYPRVVADVLGNVQQAPQLVNPKLFMLTAKNWAHVVLNYFQSLEHMADIYLKFHPTDVRVAARVAMAKQRGAEDLSAAKAARVPSIYPLANIIKDASAGANLYDRFLAFINA